MCLSENESSLCVNHHQPVGGPGPLVYKLRLMKNGSCLCLNGSSVCVCLKMGVVCVSD